MNQNNNKGRVCPICKEMYFNEPAISRQDNVTEICPTCGTKEALASLVVNSIIRKEEIKNQKPNLEYGAKIKVNNALCEYIIYGNTRLGVTPVTVVFKTENNTYFWKTTDSSKELKKFEENKKYNIKAMIANSIDNRYINYVKVI